MQNVGDGQDIDVRPFPEGSIDDGDVQVGVSEELTASRVCILAVSGVTVGWVMMIAIVTIAQRTSVWMAAVCSLRICPPTSYHFLEERLVLRYLVVRLTSAFHLGFDYSSAGSLGWSFPAEHPA